MRLIWQPQVSSVPHLEIALDIRDLQFELPGQGEDKTPTLPSLANYPTQPSVKVVAVRPGGQEVSL